MKNALWACISVRPSTCSHDCSLKLTELNLEGWFSTCEDYAILKFIPKCSPLHRYQCFYHSRALEFVFYLNPLIFACQILSFYGNIRKNDAQQPLDACCHFFACMQIEEVHYISKTVDLYFVREDLRSQFFFSAGEGSWGKLQTPFSKICSNMKQIKTYFIKAFQVTFQTRTFLCPFTV